MTQIDKEVEFVNLSTRQVYIACNAYFYFESTVFDHKLQL